MGRPARLCTSLLLLCLSSTVPVAAWRAVTGLRNHAKPTKLLRQHLRLVSTLETAGGDRLRKHALRMESGAECDMEADVVVIGSGIGGLTCGAMLAYYGDDVRVVESHSIPGGCAHGFERDGFSHDSGPSLWNGMATPPYNPLRQILNVLGEGDSVRYAQYDGWGMHVPEGSFKYKVGPNGFDDAISKFGGPGALDEWSRFMKAIEPLTKASTALSPLALRSDLGAAVTVSRFLPSLMRAGFSPDITGPISRVAEREMEDPFLLNWIEFLSFAISGLPADGTIAAAMAYTLRDLSQPGAKLDYPIGGSAAIVDALVRALNKHSAVHHGNDGGDRLMLSQHVDEIIVEKKRAVGVQLKRGGKRIRAKKAVVSNASVWDTIKLLPDGSLPEQKREDYQATPTTGSFMHLHLGIDAKGLPPDLDCHHTVINTWGKIDDPQNMVIISIPTTLDPSLAPPGHHTVHVYAAANEPYGPWEGLSRSSRDYKKLKEERAEFLWKALERVIPDVRQRVKSSLIGSPLTHERFLRRSFGSYGPALRAGEASFPGPRTPIKGLLRCGDSTFPGIGVPAVAVSGVSAANTLTPVIKHWKMLNTLAETERHLKTGRRS